MKYRFKYKKYGELESKKRVQTEVGVVKKSKKSQVSVGKNSQLGGVLGNQKSPKFQRISETEN